VTLMPGTQLGPYTVSALIGTGGMGQVYCAHDPRLGRDVAIKVSAETFTDRFTREARAIAALNHTNICHLYDVGPNYLVMELVEGECPRGPLAFEEVLPILRQLIDGIEAAHEKGIVHRDLKPANIKVTPDGVVKILDFGLAKLHDPNGPHPASDPNANSNSPTIAPRFSMEGTIQGTILGTAGYMAPEQAKGKQADRRADIWSFGVVAYELLTGQRLFQGETTVEILGAVLNKELDLSAAPARAQRLLRWCLERDRKDRLQAIGDARRLLAEEPVVVARAPAAVSRLSRLGLALGWAVAALALVGLATMSWLYVSVSWTPADQPLVHLSIPLPGNTAPSFLAISPDGRLLVMSYQGGLGLRALDSSEITPLAGTQGALTPFWSPDSRTIAFFSDGQLKTVVASGGPPQTLCDDAGRGGGTWNRDGTILFASDTGLNRVAATGGACTVLTKAEPGVAPKVPVFLPDGNHFLYVLETSDQARQGLYAASLAEPNGHRLLADPSSAVFVPNEPESNQGRLLFVREQALMAQTFDARLLQLSGDPVTVSEQVSFTRTQLQIAASAGMNGTLVYLTASRPDRQLVWYDRAGKETGRAALLGQGSGVYLAPDGKHVAFQRWDGQSMPAFWLQDLERNQETRLATPPLVPFAALVWSPDGQRVAFRTTSAGVDAIHVKSVNSGTEEILLQSARPLSPSDWSRDGQWLVYTDDNLKSAGDIWLLPNPSSASADRPELAEGRKPVPWLVTPFVESQGQISPDGKWLAYTSNESGRDGVYVRPFDRAAGPDVKWQVSTAQGREPRWRADGKELFYLEPVTGTERFKVMSVPIVAASIPFGTPTPLFEFQSISAVLQNNRFLYSPSADGQRLLLNVYATETQPSIEVLLNWGRAAGAR
jgi:serine/threonine protein kinase/Tol biopolymer transport system component